jgi:hypothetical protein
MSDYFCFSQFWTENSGDSGCWARYEMRFHGVQRTGAHKTSNPPIGIFPRKPHLILYQRKEWVERNILMLNLWGFDRFFTVKSYKENSLFFRINWVIESWIVTSIRQQIYKIKWSLNYEFDSSWIGLQFYI